MDLDASRLSAAIERLQSHCGEARHAVWMPVWGLGGSLIAHLDEYVIPAWMKGRAVVLADRPYVRNGAEINFRRPTLSDASRCAFAAADAIAVIPARGLLDGVEGAWSPSLRLLPTQAQGNTNATAPPGRTRRTLTCTTRSYGTLVAPIQDP